MPLPRLARASAAAATLAVAALVLSACSSDPTASPTPTGPDALTNFDLDNSELLSEVSWVDNGAEPPSLDFEMPFELADTAVRFIANGDGAELNDGDVVQLDYEVVYGDSGDVAFSTYTTGTPESITLSENTLSPALYSNLVGANVGAQLIFGSFDTNNPNADGSLPVILMGVTVAKAISVLATAEGTPVDPPAGLPAITVDASGVPTIDFTGTEKPAELVVQPLIEGDGPALQLGSQVSVHYTGWLWDGNVFDTSFARGGAASFTFAQGSLIDGWTQGLAGQPVGSRVLLIIPPELAYGDQESASIPAGSTLVFVVDILAAY